MKAILASVILVAVAMLAASAIAEDRPQPHDLYANRDGRAFSFERSFPSLAACDAAARSLYASKRVQGAGCKPTKPAGDAELRQLEERKIRALERAAAAEEHKARALERLR